MNAEPTPTPLASTAIAAAREIDREADFGGKLTPANAVTEIAAIIQKHFQPLLAKVEDQLTIANEFKADVDAIIKERDAASILLKTTRDQLEARERIGNATEERLRADLAAATKTLDDQTKGVWSEWWLERAKTVGELDSLKLFKVPQLEADLAAKEAESTTPKDDDSAILSEIRAALFDRNRCVIAQGRMWSVILPALVGEIDALKAELAAKEADAAMLDWLDASGNVAFMLTLSAPETPRLGRVMRIGLGLRVKYHEGKTYRECIASALASRADKGGAT